MKTLLSLFLFSFTLMAFAQDGYHSEDKPECLAGENCLRNLKSDFLIKTVLVEDYQGNVVGERLSSSSMIADTLHEKSSYCYEGDAGEICDILNLMAYDDGHATIRQFECRQVEAIVDVRYTVEYDMGYGPENYAFLLKKCQ